jgi:predicted dehydrogenase
VEKPLALTLPDADRVIRAIEKYGADVRVGYSRRYKDRYLIAKEQIVRGRLGRPIGGSARVFNSLSQALAMLARNPHATPVVDALTYYVDLMNWLLDGKRLVEVYARGQMGVLKAAGHEVADVSYTILTYDDGTVVNLGVSYALPEKYPALGHAARVEVLGTDGVMILDDDHTDQVHRKRHPARVPAGPRGEHGIPAERHPGRLGARRVLWTARERDAGVARLPVHGTVLRARISA